MTATAADALAVVKDVKKFEARIEQLAKAEKSAQSAIDRANVKADNILGKAREVEKKAKGLLAEAEARMAEAKNAEKTNADRVLAAQEETQKANAYAKKLQKDEDKISEKRDVLERDAAALKDARAEHKTKVEAFAQSVQNLAEAVV